MSPGSSTGRVIAGRYRIVAPIGSGGHGVVDLAEDLLNGGHRVALKRLEGIVGAGDPEPAAEHLRWFRHPRWAEILDEGRLDAHGRFQTLRYVDGKSLDHVELPRPADEILAFLEDGARVLGALHARGLIHYDVTPGNFLREERGGAVVFTLTDGGLANLGPVRGIARGTVLYMAPEVSDGAPHDHRADLYALGLVAFRLATGRDPWVGGAGDVLGGRRREPAPSIRTFRPDADVRVERIVAALLQREPDRRTPDAQALLALLTELGCASAASPLAGESYAAAAGGLVVGRDAEIERFRLACRALVAGPASMPLPPASSMDASTAHTAPALSDNVLLVCGPAGSGGTRLVGQYGAIAREEGVPVLAISGREGAADRRGPLRRLADGIALLTGQADMSAATGRADARPGREDLGAGDDVRMTERFITLCDKTADKTPLVLVIEDFEEFSDAAKESIRVLARHLLSRSEHPDGRAATRVLLVVDHGGEEPDGFLLPDAVDPRRPILTLAPFGADAIRALAADRFSGLDPLPEDIDTVRAATDGLPRLLVSVLAQARERGHLRRESGVWIWDASSTSTYELDRTISPAVARAIAALSPAAREVAEYLALLEVPVPEDFLRRLASAEAIAEFAATPLASVSVEGEQVRLALKSRLLRASLRSSVSTNAWTSLSQESTEIVRLPVELIPELARIACDLGRPAVALDLILSVTQLPSSAWLARSHSAVVRAIRGHARVTSSTRNALARHIGYGPTAAPLVSALLSTMETTAAADLPAIAYIARHYLRVHDPKSAAEICALSDTTSEAPDADPCVATRIAVLRLRATHSLDSSPGLATPDFGAVRRLRILGPVLRRAKPDLLGEYYLGRGRALIATRSFTRAVGVHRRAIRRSLAAHDHGLLVAALNNAAVAHRSLGNLVTAERYLLRALRVRLAMGDASGAAGQAHNLARVYQRAGRLRDAASLLHKAVAIASRHGQSSAQSLALGVLSEVQDQIGNTDLARITSLRALSVSRRSSNHQLVRHHLLVCSELASAVGEDVNCRAFLREATTVIAKDAHGGASVESIQLTSILISNNLGAGRHSRLRSANGSRSRGLTRLFRLLRNANTSSLPISEDFRRDSAVTSLRRAIAAAASARTTNREWTVHIDALKSPALKGASRRLALGLILERLNLVRSNGADRADALRRIADLSRRFDLPRLRARALATSARDALSQGDFGRAAVDISATLEALESRGPSIGLGGFQPGARVPREVLEVTQAFLDGRTDQLDFRPQRQDSHLVLHAMAHRLARRSMAMAGVDGRRESALRAVLTSASQIKAGSGVESLLGVLSDHARAITRAERACIVLVSSADGTRRVATSSREPGDHSSLDAPSATVIDRALTSRLPLLLHDVFGDSELMARPSVLAMSLRSVLCVPLLRAGEVYGVMYADSSEGAGSFDQVDLEVLSLFAEQAAAAIETSRLFADLQKSYAELKSTQDRLVRGERLRVMGEMTSGVAHEFNNLLTAILARVQLMDLGPLSEEARVHLRLIEKASMDAAAVVRRLQGFTRAQRQGTHRVIDLAEIGGDVVELLRPLWTTRRRHGRAPIVVRYRATRGLLVIGDATELREVLTNLVKNSIEAIDARGGAIGVTLLDVDGLIRAEVADDGGGIAPEIAGRLFTPFLTTKGERGTGLGLCLCQQILERHGSTLRVVSNAPIGTSVTFDLARADVRAAAQTDAMARPALLTQRPLRVLVVDDDPNVLRPLCDYLERSGLSVFAADGAQLALSSAPAFQPDIVVSDIAMPGMDGIELCSSLHRTNSQVPVVLMSGQASDVDFGRVRDSGATALLPKPFTMRQVLDLLQSIGSRRSNRLPAPNTTE